MQITIGIDISKETVVAYRLPDNQSIQVANDRAGQKTLVRWIRKQNGSLVVFEATGAYHRCLEAVLAANGTPFVIRVRRAGLPKRLDDWPRLIASTLSC
jgi:transposase